jgi:hypothetical protein
MFGRPQRAEAEPFRMFRNRAQYAWIRRLADTRRQQSNFH